MNKPTFSPAALVAIRNREQKKRQAEADAALMKKIAQERREFERRMFSKYGDIMQHALEADCCR